MDFLCEKSQAGWLEFIGISGPATGAEKWF
jgi:hypothetical protein